MNYAKKETKGNDTTRKENDPKKPSDSGQESIKGKIIKKP